MKKKIHPNYHKISVVMTDGSKFEEFKPLYGSSLVCGWASVHGYQIGIIGNNGPIYPESAEYHEQCLIFLARIPLCDL